MNGVFPDDIPIQLSKDDKGGSGGNPSGALNMSTSLDTSSQLQSINEEGEASSDGQHAAAAANLSRNTPGRQSKDFSAKLHKVSFPNFKKSKDREGKGKSGGGGGGSSSSLAGMAMGELNNNNKQQDGQQVVTVAPTKKTSSILKDKLINRNSSSSEILEGGSEKMSIKMKNVSLDSGTSTATMGGGGSGGANSNSIASNNSFDGTESSSEPLENSLLQQRPSILPLEKSQSHTNGNGNNVQVYQL